MFAAQDWRWLMIFATPNAEKASRELKRTVGACAQNPIRAMALIA